jgi:hypothetical protein
MKLVVIMGPHAVGKMTVGQELAKITGLKLFHNHMTIELVRNFYSYSTPEGKRLVKLFREEIFKSVAASDLDGMIFTYMCAVELSEEWEYLKSVADIFESKGGEVYYVELEADYNVRLERNKSPNRLEHKASKRDIENSEAFMIQVEKQYRLNTYDGEVSFKNYIKIDNTDIEPDVAAKIIKERFNL